MIDERIERILQDEIDGIASAEECREIQTLIAEDSTVRVYRERLQSVAQGIEDLPVVPTPAELKPRVMDSLLTPSASSPNPGTSLADTFSGWFRMRTLAPFGVGMAAAALGFALLGDLPQTDSTAASGTLGAASITDAPRVLVEETNLVSTGTVTREGSQVTFELGLETTDPVEVTILFDAKVLEPNGVLQLGATTRALLVQPDRVRLDHAGSNRYRLTWNAKEAASSSLRITFRSGEREWLQTVEIPSVS